MKLRELCEAIDFDIDDFLRTGHQTPSMCTETVSVYIIACSKYLKVGKARDVAARMDSLQAACPLEMKLVTTRELIGTRYALLCERTTHKILAHLHHRGEWFQCKRGVATLALDIAFRATQILRRKHMQRLLRPVNDNVAAMVFPYSPMARRGQ